MRRALAILAFALAAAAAHAQEAVTLPIPPLTAEAVNAADISTLAAIYAPPVETADPAVTAERHPDPAVVRLQVLLDRAGASPGVIDGFDGDNVRKAVLAFELMRGLPPDGALDPEMLAALETGGPVIGDYAIIADDLNAIGEPIPKDYAEQAKRKFLGYTSIEESLAERFHMDIDLLKALNPGAGYTVGEPIYVAAYGPDLKGEVVRIEADKSLRQVRAYGADNRLLAAYPATIGSEENPSPSGTHIVEGVAPMPEYTYNPKVNFQQGENTEVLTIPPGPNGPVGSMWIDLSEPTFGIHGTPEPSLIDKTGSHGCVRLTNWDANELAKMVKPGVPVDFVG
ncbi:L,D-transpeptidase [Devosia sp. LjRoot16]|uniref:L,D-transpeptidase family protein n=1 Tax=Devosia sp. LjRoot16 TaxID=3342271 RepID=UPI003ECEB0BF